SYAAMRYTESKLTPYAEVLLGELKQGTVDWVTNFDGTLTEPLNLPARLPNILLNGGSGIAVGMATDILPHNLNEVVSACIRLLDKPKSSLVDVMDHIKGPDFPTGAEIISPQQEIEQIYETGRGAIRVRGRFSTGRDEAGNWEETGVEKLGGGQWQLVVSEIPYMVQKSKLIEQIAQLIADKKLPILEDIRDESDEQIRLVLIPKSRNVDPELLKESLYKLTDLENRFGLNLNVLDSHRTPGVLGLKLVLQEWVISQIDILLRRSQHRLDKIANRLELLGGYIIAYLNLDRIIEIIRTEDEPKPVMMVEFELTDRQAEAILNMRLRSLRKLEEMELRKERDALLAEQEELQKLLDSPARQRTRLKRDLNALRKDYAEDTLLGRRRTTIAEAAPTREFSMDAMIEKEPVTVILSAKGWIRAAKGHVPLDGDFKYKEGDGPAFAFHCQTTDKLLVAVDNGRFYTVGADKLPGARGFGEPIRTMVDIDSDAQIISVTVYKPKGQLLLAANTGRGFAAEMDELLAETRKGRGVVSTKPGVKLAVVREIAPEHDHVAVMGENRKLVIFALSEVPLLAKGQGVTLQRYKDGEMSDVITLKLEDGLTWTMGGESGRTRVEKDLLPWKVARGAAGRLPPNGFPRDNRF
ncbi:MAG: DNA topoisomerase IV subunit A, partial [Novosphingobium sp.]